MRHALTRLAGPAVDALVRRWERRVTSEDHVRLAERLLAPGQGMRAPSMLAQLDRQDRDWVRRALAARAKAWSDGVDAPAQDVPAAVLTETRDSRALLEPIENEASSRAVVFHLLALGGPVSETGLASAWLDDPLATLAARCSLAPGQETRATPALTLLLLAGVNSGAVSRPGAQAVLATLSATLPARRWFVRAGTPYGGANLLRVMWRLGGAGQSLQPYLEEVCERLLRHVEIRRTHALCFRAADSLHRWQERLERLRFTHALLDAAELRNDLRHLNTALKRNDWDHRVAKKLAQATRPSDALLGLHHAAAITRQELLMRRHFP